MADVKRLLGINTFTRVEMIYKQAYASDYERKEKVFTPSLNSEKCKCSHSTFYYNTHL